MAATTTGYLSLATEGVRAPTPGLSAVCMVGSPGPESVSGSSRESVPGMANPPGLWLRMGAEQLGVAGGEVTEAQMRAVRPGPASRRRGDASIRRTGRGDEARCGLPDVCRAGAVPTAGGGCRGGVRHRSRPVTVRGRTQPDRGERGPARSSGGGRFRHGLHPGQVRLGAVGARRPAGTGRRWRTPTTRPSAPRSAGSSPMPPTPVPDTRAQRRSTPPAWWRRLGARRRPVRRRPTAGSRCACRSRRSPRSPTPGPATPPMLDPLPGCRAGRATLLRVRQTLLEPRLALMRHPARAGQMRATRLSVGSRNESDEPGAWTEPRQARSYPQRNKQPMSGNAHYGSGSNWAAASL